MKTDSELQKDVMAELKWVPSIDAAEIGVAVKDGVVTLSGNVDNYKEKWDAERAAERVFGVAAVAEEIKVRLPGSSSRTDEEIARAAADALKWNMQVPHDRIKVQVQNGWLTLKGEAEWQYQKDAAGDAVRNLMGLLSVSNEITVKPTVQAVDVKSKIERALQRNALLDARRISVEAESNKVILNGNVRTWIEREQAQWAAWAAPGVSEVQNNIRIGP
jgi:osmotically-inducible protein OsmY